MANKIKKSGRETFFIIVCMIAFLNAKSQSDLVLYNYNRIPQTVYTNPAKIPPGSFAIGLPLISSFSNRLYNDAFSTNDLFRSRNTDDSLSLDVANILPMLGTKNHFSEYSSIDVFFIGLRVNGGYLSFGLKSEALINVHYPKQLAEFIWYGNKRYLGETLDFSDFKINLNHYLCYHVGYAFRVADNLSMGVRLKHLHGLSNISFKKMNSRVITKFNNNDLFTFEADNDILINTSGVNGLEFGADNGFSLNDYIKNKINAGFGVDFGLDWQADKNLNISFSVVDLGYIYWQSDVVNHFNSEPHVEFSSVEVDLTSNTNALNVYIDSLNNVFKFKKSEKPYMTRLPTRLYFGGFYNIDKRNRVGALIAGQVYDNHTETAVCLSYDFMIGRNLNLKTTWSAINNTFDNLGLGGVLSFGPVQLYFLTENIVSIFDPWNAHSHSFRFGLVINIFTIHDRPPKYGYSNDYPYYKVEGPDALPLREQMQNYWEKKRIRQKKKKQR